eukprot:scaffold11299_cov40-Phaeocystis_antarctica.AAC.2
MAAQWAAGLRRDREPLGPCDGQHDAHTHARAAVGVALGAAHQEAVHDAERLHAHGVRLRVGSDEAPDETLLEVREAQARPEDGSVRLGVAPHPDLDLVGIGARAKGQGQGWGEGEGSDRDLDHPQREVGDRRDEAAEERGAHLAYGVAAVVVEPVGPVVPRRKLVAYRGRARPRVAVEVGRAPEYVEGVPLGVA